MNVFFVKSYPSDEIIILILNTLGEIYIMSADNVFRRQSYDFSILNVDTW